MSDTQHNVHVVGEARETCIVRGKAANLRFIVVDADVVPILGRKACELLSLVKRVCTVESEDIYKGIGCITHYVYDADLLENAKHLDNKPPRKVPFAIMEEVKQ